MIKVWTDKNDLENIKWSYSDYFYYYFGLQVKDSLDFFNIEKINISENKYFELVEDINEADIIIPLHSATVLYKNFKNTFDKYIDLSKKHNKTILLNLMGDFPIKIDIKNSIELKNSIYRYEYKKNEIAVPALIEDLGDKRFLIQDKKESPSIGFVGFADYPNLKSKLKVLLQVVYTYLFQRDKVSQIRGIYFRKRILNSLQKSKLITQNFLIRKYYSGIKKDVEHFDKLREEYINNLKSSDYILCIKGDGNYSLRFYETLSMGKIPILVDTDKVLPLEDVIDYKKFCIIINVKDINNIDKIVYDFHSNLTNEEFKNIQQLARTTYEKYLNMSDFYKVLFNNIGKKDRKEI